MPRYEYRCPHGHVIELFRPMAESSDAIREPCIHTEGAGNVCRFDRVLSPFNGSFGDTPIHHE